MSNSKIPFTASGDQQSFDSLTNNKQRKFVISLNSNAIAVLIRRMTCNDRHPVELGQTHPYCMDHGSNRSGQGIDWIRRKLK